MDSLFVTSVRIVYTFMLVFAKEEMALGAEERTEVRRPGIIRFLVGACARNFEIERPMPEPPPVMRMVFS
jgi:hypothetical protein